MSQLLGFRPRPEPDEILTSWLCRVAIENGTTLARLIASCTPDTHFPVLDLDQRLPPLLLHRLAERTGLHWEVIVRTTLTPLYDLYVGKKIFHGAYRWFMPVQPVRQRYTTHGMQVCPDCLATDAVPYYRQHWRLSFVTTCPDHECLLLDRCPACAAPIDFRASCDSRALVSSHDALAALCQCGQCGVDYRQFAWRTLDQDLSLEDRRVAWGGVYAEEGRSSERMEQEKQVLLASNWQRKITHPQDGRWVPLGGGFIEVREYLDGCRSLLRLLTYEKLAVKFRELVAAESSYRRRDLGPARRNRLEYSSLEARHVSIILLTWLLADWPIRFHRMCKQSQISRTALFCNEWVLETPVWLERQCLAYLDGRVEHRGRKPKLLF